MRMRVVEKSYGFRLESPRDEHGHGDLGTAFSLALLAATTSFEPEWDRMLLISTPNRG